MQAALSPSEPLSAFVERARGLYTLPAVAVKVLDLTSSPQVDARALKNCIENDPALAAKLLRVVNSSLFGLSRQVSDLNQALALLGVKPLKLLVLGFSLPKALFDGLEAKTLARYWRRTLTKATAARDFAETVSRRGSDEAFLAGLLQDLGQLALVQYLGEPYLTFLQRAKQEPGDLAMRELAALGFDHTMLSARMLQHWELPDTLVTSVAQRQEIEHLAALPTEPRTLPQMLHLAELAARLVVDGQADALRELYEAGRRYGTLMPESLEALLAPLAEKVEQLGEALDLELCERIDCEQLLQEAHTRLHAVAASAVQEFTQAAEETRLWREAETLRETTAAFLGGGVSRQWNRPEVVSQNAASSPSPRVHASSLPAASASARAASPRYDEELLARIEAAVMNCRQRRQAVSLLAAGIDNEANLASVSGVEGVRRAVHLIIAAARSLEANSSWQLVGPTQAAIILEGCERAHAVAHARRLGQIVAHCVATRQEWFGALTLSVGAATLALPPRNFPPHELIEAAWRCLSAAQVSGGATVKSIDIY